jgi:hypothetical protein
MSLTFGEESESISVIKMQIKHGFESINTMYSKLLRGVMKPLKLILHAMQSKPYALHVSRDMFVYGGINEEMR